MKKSLKTSSEESSEEERQKETSLAGELLNKEASIIFNPPTVEKRYVGMGKKSISLNFYIFKGGQFPTDISIIALPESAELSTTNEVAIITITRDLREFEEAREPCLYEYRNSNGSSLNGNKFTRCFCSYPLWSRRIKR